MAHDTDLTQGRIAVPVWERYTLSVEEAAVYFRIGEHENKDADFILWNGNRPQIKRKKFEQLIDHSSLV